MRFRLRDLLIAIVIIATGANLASVYLPQSSLNGSPLLVAGACGVAGYLVVSSFLYRWFQLFPLLLPRCPNCRDRNRHYLSLKQDWPCETVRCAVCGATIELCADSNGAKPGVADALRFRLLWPYSVGGRWRREP